MTIIATHQPVDLPGLLPIQGVLDLVGCFVGLGFGLVDHLVDLVFGVVDLLLGLTSAPIGLAFGFEVLVPGEESSGLLGAALHLIGLATHLAPPSRSSTSILLLHDDPGSST